MDKTYHITSLVRRINVRLHKLCPSAQLIWDYRKQNYYLHIYDSPEQIRGPIYHTDLLAFATYINLWKIKERPLHKILITSTGFKEEGKLRSDLQLAFRTAFENAYLIRKMPGHPPEKVAFLPNSANEEGGLAESIPEHFEEDELESPELQERIATLMKV